MQVSTFAVGKSVCQGRASRTSTRRVAVRAENDQDGWKARAQEVPEKAQEFAAHTVNRDTSFAEDARRSLNPRVEELEEQLAKGMSKREDVFGALGPVPEIFNGRLAMWGFFACLGAELASQRTIWEQLRIAPVGISVTVAALFIATVVPILRGGADKYLPPREKEGFLRSSGFTLTNELLLGRSAMVGMLILITYETINGRPIFPSWN